MIDNLSGLDIQGRPKESEHSLQMALAAQGVQNVSGAYKKMCARHGPTLQLDVAALRRHAPLQAPPELAVIDPLGLRNLHNVNLRKGLTKCRHRHGQARPIICVPFRAITSSLCVSISLFPSFPPFLRYGHRLRPVHKRADRLRGAHFGRPKKGSKMPQAYFFLFFLWVFCLVVYLLFHGPAQYRKKGAQSCNL